MEEECVIVDETSGTTPPQKKMKQSRLPFTPLQGKSPKTVTKQLKRKLSSSDLDCKSPKTPRSESESTPGNKIEGETELYDTQDTKEKENDTKDEEIESIDDHEMTSDIKEEELKENLKKRGRSSVNKNKTPAKSTPSRNKTPARSTPSRNKTPAKSTPDSKTPAKSTPDSKTPAKSTPGSNKTTAKSTPSSNKTTAKSTPSSNKTPAKSTPSRNKTPAKSTSKNKTPAKSTQNTETEKNNGDCNEDSVDDQVHKAKKRGRPSVSGKTPGKSSTPEAKKSEQMDESGKQGCKLKKIKTPNKDKDLISKKEKTPGKFAKKFDKSAKKDSGEEIVIEDKIGNKLQPLPNISDEEDSVQINKSESDLLEEKSNIEKLDNKVQISKDESKKRKATDEMSKLNTTSKTAAEISQNEKDKSVKKKLRNSLDAFVKKGAEAIAMKENGAKAKKEIVKGKTTDGDINDESESFKSPTATNKSLSSNESKSPESENTKSPNFKTPLKSPQSVKPIKLTPGQLAKEAERLKKKEEREKEKEEKLKKKQQEIEDKKKMKEEERKLREEEKKKKDEEREREKKQKEEERLQKLEEKEQQRKELEKEKEEKKRIKQEAIEAKLKEKEEKRLKMEEEKRLQEEEERRQKEQAKAKFSNFFVVKKVVPTSIPEEKKNKYFCQFQVKNNMRLAPVIRHQLANESKESLDEYISGNRKESKENLFINAIKVSGYTIGTSARTYPPQEQKEDENDCEVIEEEDDGIGEEVITSESIPKGKTTVRRKVLKFCENNRPPYRGTWRKTTKQISARRPFRKDEDMFNYEYDSDDDWEEEANGESLSDCEDEKDEEEGGKAEAENDYEVDNDFFVPHGYLSDDEGKSDQEEEENEMEVDEKDTDKKKEQLKQKQTDFENEIKQKTRQLKPRVFGCLWLSEEDTNKAFDQLLKVLNPHRAVVCCSSQLPIATSYSKGKPKDLSKEVNDSSQDGDDAAGASQGDKYAKNFPEEGVPALIKLLHCNRNSKVFLGKEFCEYWKKNSEEGVDDSMASRHGLLAKAKIDAKISELGAIWGKNTEGGTKAKYLMWALPLEVREKYGLSDLPSTNTWTYILKPKEKKTQDVSEEPSVEPKTPRNNKDSKTPKITADSKTPKITAFAKKCSPGSINNFSKTPSGIPSSGSTNGETPKTTGTPLEASSAKTPRTPSEASTNPGSQKKLFSKVPQEQSTTNTPSKTPKSSIANFFKKKVDKECPKDGEYKVKKEENNEKLEEESGTKDEEDKVKKGENHEKLKEESGTIDDVITLD